MTTTENLWPEFSLESLDKSPKIILVEQAKFLAQNTKNLLTANIRTYTGIDGQLQHTFDIVAPALNNYRYSLFTVVQKNILPYPCYFESQFGDSIESESELIKELKKIFNNSDTLKIINALISQSKSKEED